MHANETAEDTVLREREIKAVALVANRPKAGVTTLTAMLSLEAYEQTGAEILVADPNGGHELERWRSQAMWSPGATPGEDWHEGWDGDDLRGPVVRSCYGSHGVDFVVREGHAVGCAFGLADGGVATEAGLGDVLPDTDFVVVVVTSNDEDGLAGRGAEAALVAAGKPGGLVLNMAEEGDTRTEAALASLRAPGRLPLLAVVPRTRQVAAVLPQGLDHLEACPEDAGAVAVEGL